MSALILWSSIDSFELFELSEKLRALVRSDRFFLIGLAEVQIHYYSFDSSMEFWQLHPLFWLTVDTPDLLVLDEISTHPPPTSPSFPF
jgi:hypothetical protein